MTNSEQSSVPHGGASGPEHAPSQPDQGDIRVSVSSSQVGDQQGGGASLSSIVPISPARYFFVYSYRPSDYSSSLGTQTSDSGPSSLGGQPPDSGVSRRQDSPPFRLRPHVFQPEVPRLSHRYTFTRSRRLGAVFAGILILSTASCLIVRVFTWEKKVPAFDPKNYNMLPYRRGEAAVLDISVQIIYGPQSDEFFSTLYSGADIVDLFVEQPDLSLSDGRRFTVAPQYHGQFKNLLDVLRWMDADAKNGKNSLRDVIVTYLDNQATTSKSDDELFLTQKESFLDAYDAYIAKLQQLQPPPGQRYDDALLAFFAKERSDYYKSLLNRSPHLTDAERQVIRRRLQVLSAFVSIYQQYSYFQSAGANLSEDIFWQRYIM